MEKELTYVLVIVLGLVFVRADITSNNISTPIPTDGSVTVATPIITTSLSADNANTTTTTTPTHGNESTTTTAPTTTTVPTTPGTNGTTPAPANSTTPTTPTTTPTTVAPSTVNTTTTPAAPTTTSPVSTTTAWPTKAPSPPEPSKGGFGWGSFFSGIVFTMGLSAVGYIAWRFHKRRSEGNYHTL